MLSKDIQRRFNDDNYDEKTICRLILPYYFNFRHFVELSLKALIATLSEKTPKVSHNLHDLLSELKKEFDNYDYENTDILITEKEFNENKNIALNIYNNMSELIIEYANKEPAVEYYRYIFEIEGKKKNKHLSLKDSAISLDYNTVDKQFREIKKSIYEFCRILSYIKYTNYLM